MEDIIGYDCDGNEIEEYRVLRAPFSELIDDWEQTLTQNKLKMKN